MFFLLCALLKKQKKTKKYNFQKSPEIPKVYASVVMSVCNSNSIQKFPSF